MSRPSALPPSSNSTERAFSSETENGCVLYLLTENELRQINGPIRASDCSAPSAHESGEARPNFPHNLPERPNGGQDNNMYMLTGEELRAINGAMTGHSTVSSKGSSSRSAEIITFLDQPQEGLDEQAAVQTCRPEISRFYDHVRSLRNSHIQLMYRFVREHSDLLEVNQKLRDWARGK
ncbi:hypothetical protein BGZ75_002429 [Mortierella antarctica]|nr:hypothetical protein BGZ75_002429 [Mortierella antarctica]